MAKNNASISNDVDFIKEFEELKIKQKLLIESLNKKNISQQNQLFLEINSKLDFLVKIFKDANENDSKAEDEKLESHFKDVLDKLDLMQKSFDTKLEDMNKKNENLSEELKLIKEKLSSPVVSLSVPMSNSNNSMPSPDFKVKNSNAKDVIAPPPVQNVASVSAKVEEKKDKKGWFG